MASHERLRQDREVAGRRIRLVLALFPIVLLLLGCVVFGWTTWQSAQRETRLEVASIGSSTAASLREIFNALETTLVVTASRLLEAGAIEDPERARPLIDRLLDSNPSLVAFGLASPDGQLRLVNGVPAGQPLPNLRQREGTRGRFDAPWLRAVAWWSVEPISWRPWATGCCPSGWRYARTTVRSSP